jgi:peptidoglycan/LPS O-acetylase OafA/YrhL
MSGGERKKFNLAWMLMVELRKETIDAQRIRAQVIGFKITFVSAGIGIIAANADGFQSQLFYIPAFAAIFFDFLIHSYSYSIKRIGYYCRKCLEPKLREYSKWPENDPLWEEFMTTKKAKQHLALIGHIGITCLAVIVAFFATSPLSIPLISILFLSLGGDIITFRLITLRFSNEKK